MWRNATAAVVMAAALTGCTDGGSSPTTSASPSSAVPTTALPTGTTPTGSPSASPCPAAPLLPAGATLVTATVKDGKVTTEHSTWSVKTGSKVRIAVSADVVDEVHVHTYDAKGDTVPGCATAIDLTASIPGSHEVELEKAHKLLFRLRVS